jgi:hypothetical protein
MNNNNNNNILMSILFHPHEVYKLIFFQKFILYRLPPNILFAYQ